MGGGAARRPRRARASTAPAAPKNHTDSAGISQSQSDHPVRQERMIAARTAAIAWGPGPHEARDRPYEGRGERRRGGARCRPTRARRGPRSRASAPRGHGSLAARRLAPTRAGRSPRPCRAEGASRPSSSATFQLSRRPLLATLARRVRRSPRPAAVAIDELAPLVFHGSAGPTPRRRRPSATRVTMAAPRRRPCASARRSGLEHPLGRSAATATAAAPAATVQTTIHTRSSAPRPCHPRPSSCRSSATRRPRPAARRPRDGRRGHAPEQPARAGHRPRRGRRRRSPPDPPAREREEDRHREHREHGGRGDPDAARLTHRRGQVRARTPPSAVDIAQVFQYVIGYSSARRGPPPGRQRRRQQACEEADPDDGRDARADPPEQRPRPPRGALVRAPRARARGGRTGSGRTRSAPGRASPTTRRTSASTPRRGWTRRPPTASGPLHPANGRSARVTSATSTTQQNGDGDARRDGEEAAGIESQDRGRSAGNRDGGGGAAPARGSQRIYQRTFTAASVVRWGNPRPAYGRLIACDPSHRVANMAVAALHRPLFRVGRPNPEHRTLRRNPRRMRTNLKVMESADDHRDVGAGGWSQLAWLAAAARVMSSSQSRRRVVQNAGAVLPVRRLLLMSDLIVGGDHRRDRRRPSPASLGDLPPRHRWSSRPSSRWPGPLLAFMGGLYAVDHLGAWASGIGEAAALAVTSLRLSGRFRPVTARSARRLRRRARSSAPLPLLPSLAGVARSGAPGLSTARLAAPAHADPRLRPGRRPTRRAPAASTPSSASLRSALSTTTPRPARSACPGSAASTTSRPIVLGRVERVMIAFSRASHEELLDVCAPAATPASPSTSSRGCSSSSTARAPRAGRRLPLLSIEARGFRAVARRQARRSTSRRGVLLFALPPLLTLIAIAIKLESRGPVLFRQPRAGRGGRISSSQVPLDAASSATGRCATTA